MFFRASVLLLLLVALIVMVGALPAGEAVPVAIFQSPLFVLLLVLLGASCLACCFRWKPSWRRSGLLVTHLAVPVILVGALWGAIAERNLSVRCRIGDEPRTKLSLTRMDASVDLPFWLTVVDLDPLPEYVWHQTDPETPHGFRRAGRYVPGADGIVLPDGEVVGMDTLRPDGVSWSPRVELDSGSLLLFRRGPGEYCRATVRVEREDAATSVHKLEHGEAVTIDDVKLKLDGLAWVSDSDVWVKCLAMLSGRDVWESILVKPGREGRGRRFMLMHLTLPFALAVTDFQVERFPPDYALYAPSEMPDGDLLYEDTYSVGADGIVVDGDVLAAPETLRGDAEEWVSHLDLADGRVLNRQPPGDKHYEAELLVESADEAQTFTLAVNHPVSYGGWRFYLVSYDRDPSGPNYVDLTARRDPGRLWVVVGVWLLMAGTFLNAFSPTGRDADA